jgi:hypothetical protein
MPPLARNDKPGGDEGAVDVVGTAVAVVVKLDGVVAVAAANVSRVLDGDVGDYKAHVGIKFGWDQRARLFRLPLQPLSMSIYCH